MKKVIALILAAVMLFGVLPVCAGAVAYTKSDTFKTSNEVTTNREIPDGITMTVPSDVTLYIPSGVTLTVQDGGCLNVLGTIVVLNGGKLVVDGMIKHGTNVTTESPAATAVAAVKYPAAADYIADSATFSVTVKATYNKSSAEDDVVTTDVTAGGTVYAALGYNVSTAVKFDDAKYDAAFFTVYYDGVSADYIQGKCTIKVTDSHKVTYIPAEKDSDFYKNCIIYLPTGKGYEVIGRDGEMTEDGTVKIKYGTYFSFKVEVDSSYDQSAIDVYAYNGYGYLNLDTSNGNLKDAETLEKDEYGYYTLYVDADKTIQVEGALSNSSIGTMNTIMDTIRYIFEMIMSFFKKIAESIGLTV